MVLAKTGNRHHNTAGVCNQLSISCGAFLCADFIQAEFLFVLSYFSPLPVQFYDQTTCRNVYKLLIWPKLFFHKKDSFYFI
jgi:hypothetical protein